MHQDIEEELATMRRRRTRFWVKALFLLLTSSGLVTALVILRSRSDDGIEWNRSSLYLPESPEYPHEAVGLQPAPRLKHLKCTPRQDVYFLKVHRCASTTVTSIFLRYAQNYRLTFAQTRVVGFENTTGALGWPERFRPDHVVGTYVRGSSPNRKYEYDEFLEGQKINVVALHTIYDQESVRSVMPDDTVSIAILRKPFEQFQSVFDFSEFNVIHHANLTDPDPMTAFLESPGKYDKPLFGKKYIKNFMITEFGFQNKDESDGNRIASFLNFIDKRFPLVLIAEHFYESVILLKRYLCWKTEDVVFLKLRVNHEKRHYVSPQDDLVRYLYLEAIHRSWSKADHILYDHFNKTLWKRIQSESDDFEDEVNHLRYVVNEIASFCEHPPDDTVLNFKPTRWGDAFNISASSCSFLNLSLHTGIYEPLEDGPGEQGHYNMGRFIGLLVAPLVFACLFLLAVVIAYTSRICWPQKIPVVFRKKARYS